MIKHSLEKINEPIIHEVKIPIARKELQRIRMLLDLKSLEEWEDSRLERMGIVKDSCEGVFGVSFNDGAVLDWNLCCGSNNYYDDVIFTRPNGSCETLDCTYELDDIEIDTGTDTYIVKLDIQDE